MEKQTTEVGADKQIKTTAAELDEIDLSKEPVKKIPTLTLSQLIEKEKWDGIFEKMFETMKEKLPDLYKQIDLNAEVYNTDDFKDEKSLPEDKVFGIFRHWYTDDPDDYAYHDH